MDGVYAATGGAKGGDVHKGIVNVVGVQFTVLSVIIFTSTFIPKGAFSLNPDALYGENLDTELDIEVLTKRDHDAAGAGGDDVHELSEKVYLGLGRSE